MPVPPWAAPWGGRLHTSGSTDTQEDHRQRRRGRCGLASPRQPPLSPCPLPRSTHAGAQIIGSYGEGVIVRRFPPIGMNPLDPNHVFCLLPHLKLPATPLPSMVASLHTYTHMSTLRFAGIWKDRSLFPRVQQDSVGRQEGACGIQSCLPPFPWPHCPPPAAPESTKPGTGRIRERCPCQGRVQSHFHLVGRKDQQVIGLQGKDLALAASREAWLGAWVSTALALCP